MTKRKIYSLCFLFLIFGIIIGVTSIVIAESINSNEVLYDNSSSGTNLNNVQDVLDDVYNIIEHNSTGFSLLARTPNKLSPNLIAGLYRYQGVQDSVNDVNNYICFGTSNKSDCLNNIELFMYRIIGIDSNGRIKLIKRNPLNIEYQWNSTTNVLWPASDMYRGLNDEYFLNNTTYIPNENWKNRIINVDWHYATIGDSSVSTVTQNELSGPIVNAKIGLLYLHDYFNSLVNPSYLNTSWLNINNVGIANLYGDWSITRVNTNKVWILHCGGIADSWGGSIDSGRPTRPVFFIGATERIASGSGTITDPYILS